MASSVTIPLWLAVLAGLLAAVALIDRLFAPAFRWWLRRRVNRAIDELNQRLKLTIPPFKLARRRQLIEQLMFDPEVLKAVEPVVLEHELKAHSVMFSMADIFKIMGPNSAEYMHMSDQIGSLDTGKLADIILLDGNPLDGIAAMLKTKVVVKGGKVVVDKR